MSLPAAAADLRAGLESPAKCSGLSLICGVATGPLFLRRIEQIARGCSSQPSTEAAVAEELLLGLTKCRGVFEVAKPQGKKVLLKKCGYLLGLLWLAADAAEERRFERSREDAGRTAKWRDLQHLSNKYGMPEEAKYGVDSEK